MSFPLHAHQDIRRSLQSFCLVCQLPIRCSVAFFFSHSFSRLAAALLLILCSRSQSNSNCSFDELRHDRLELLLALIYEALLDLGKLSLFVRHFE